MGIFKRKKDEYDIIYDEETGESPEDAIERLRGTISKGDCLYCNGKHTMKYTGDICFVCSECGQSVHEDIYYLWAAGYPIELNG